MTDDIALPGEPVTRRCPEPGVPLTAGDQAEVERFAAYLRDPDPDRTAAYLRHYPEHAPSDPPAQEPTP